MSQTLKDLLARWQRAAAQYQSPPPPPYHGHDLVLENLVEHTDDVKPGSAFVARVRQNSDGHPYVEQAFERGAVLAIGQQTARALDLHPPAGAVYWQVPDTALTLAWLTAAWHDFPGRRLVTIGVTGTDGKTTTCNLLYEILRAAGLRVGLISTIKAVFGEEEEPTGLHVTTPEAPAVQRYLARMVAEGLTHCVLETTSIGLAQHRVTAVGFAAGLVTNITHEHVNDHGSLEAYVAAKTRLLTMVAEQRRAGGAGWAVLNRDDGSFASLSLVAGVRQRTYGIDLPADVTADDLTFGADATWFTLRLPGDIVLPIRSPLVGRFNVYNMLCAAAGGVCLEVPPAAIQAGLQQVTGIAGRMERVDEGQDFLAVVDFAHTPNALEKAIEAARSMLASPDRRVITVFGSAGKRDVDKRRMMAEISAAQADLTVLTAEDPRTESLDAILEAMAAGCRSRGRVEGRDFWRVPDRGQAIHFALTLARPGDIVLLCGKGHEESMCFGTVEYPWDERAATRAALKALLAGTKMVDLGLPSFNPAFLPPPTG